ncbi:hypothetical protein EJ04DRAFT_561598 [Polyplosphaeria fusca]|uniref:Uncharacterized protein n=1 Tax=Polyplosphaeria fusca TaxID=682080 RepID=A0A9P4R2H4_9PLEO|nr:hypothetical protein EJ04DRAFT_561598 [Polyplosphaeria fusca]
MPQRNSSPAPPRRRRRRRHHHPSPQPPANPHTRNDSTVDDLLHMIDDHLAQTLARDHAPHPSSRGTMFVDWNGEGDSEPVVSYRNDPRPAPTAPPVPAALPAAASSSSVRQTPTPSTHRPQPDSQHQRRHRHPHRDAPLWIQGFDPATSLAYDYDGRVFHVYRDGGASAVSEYFAVDAGVVESGGAWRVVGDSEEEGGERTGRRGRVVEFVKRVLGRLREGGFLRERE